MTKDSSETHPDNEKRPSGAGDSVADLTEREYVQLIDRLEPDMRRRVAEAMGAEEYAAAVSYLELEREVGLSLVDEAPALHEVVVRKQRENTVGQGYDSHVDDLMGEPMSIERVKDRALKGAVLDLHDEDAKRLPPVVRKYYEEYLDQRVILGDFLAMESDGLVLDEIGPSYIEVSFKHLLFGEIFIKLEGEDGALVTQVYTQRPGERVDYLGIVAPDIITLVKGSVGRALKRYLGDAGTGRA